MKLVVGLNAFLEYVSKQKVWALTWTCFVAVFWFLVFVYGSLPTRIADFHRFSVTIEGYTADGDRVLFLYDAIHEALQAYLRASEYYRKHFASRPTSDSIDPVLLTDGLRFAVDAERTSSFATGRVAGMHFQDPRLNSFREGFESDMKHARGISSDLVDFYGRLIANDRSGAVRAINRVDSAQRSEKAVELHTRLKDFDQTAHNIQQANMIEIAEKTAKLRLFWLTVYATIPALLFEGAVLVIALRNLVSYTGTAQKKPK